MPGPRIDPNAPQPRFGPLWVGVALTVIGIVGAVFVYRSGSSTLRSDQERIRSYLSEAEPFVTILRSVVNGYDTLDPVERERETRLRLGDAQVALSGVQAAFEAGFVPPSAASGERASVPEILEPLHTRWLAAVEAALDVARLREGPLDPAVFHAAVTDAHAAFDEAERERDEILCAARMIC